MPDEPADPIETLRTIRTLAKVTLEAEPDGETPEAKAKRHAEHLRMILTLCEKAMPLKRLPRKPKPPIPDTP